MNVFIVKRRAEMEKSLSDMSMHKKDSQSEDYESFFMAFQTNLDTSSAYSFMLLIAVLIIAVR